MKHFKCTVHNIDFAYPEVVNPHYYCECPWCLQDDIRKVREELQASKEHRATLLRAIEIKRTVEPLEKP